MLTPRQQYLFRGHPTSPGRRDLVASAAGVMGSDRFTRDGKPGIPRYVFPLPRDYHADPGNLRSTNGPKQPGVVYRGELPQIPPWNATNERLRRATIQAFQSGSQ